MNALFFGLGSIGRRHWDILVDKWPEVERYHYDRSALWSQPSDIFPDMAFICNPTQYHIETARKCVEYGIKNLFIEKPLSLSMKGVRELAELCDQEGVSTYIAYPFRHHPIIKAAKGQEYDYLGLYCFSNAAKWPGERAKDHVLFELSHELDMAYYLTGNDHYTGFITDKRAVIGSKWPKVHISIDIDAPFEARYVQFWAKDAHELTVAGCYEAQIAYYLDNLGNQRMTNNIHEASKLLANIVNMVEVSRQLKP